MKKILAWVFLYLLLVATSVLACLGYLFGYCRFFVFLPIEAVTLLLLGGVTTRCLFESRHKSLPYGGEVNITIKDNEPFAWLSTDLDIDKFLSYKEVKMSVVDRR